MTKQTLENAEVLTGNPTFTLSSASALFPRRTFPERRRRYGDKALRAIDTFQSFFCFKKTMQQMFCRSSHMCPEVRKRRRSWRRSHVGGTASKARIRAPLCSSKRVLESMFLFLSCCICVISLRQASYLERGGGGFCKQSHATYAHMQMCCAALSAAS